MVVYRFYEIHSGRALFVGRSTKDSQLQKFMDKELRAGVEKLVGITNAK